MRVAAVLLSFVLLQAGSNAIPILPSGILPPEDYPLNLNENPTVAEQLAGKGYEGPPLTRYSINPFPNEKKKAPASMLS